MEIVTLYVPVLTGKNEEHAVWFYEIGCSVYAVTAEPFPVWVDSGYRSLYSRHVTQKSLE